MKIFINYYAGLKDSFGAREEREVDEGLTAELLIEMLKEKSPPSGAVLGVTRVAVNEELVERGVTLQEGDVVDLLPPSSGG